jgi:hypothetical protein
MGFWQGINEGLSEVMAQKERQRELEARQRETEQEREFRRQEVAASRAFEREQFMTQLTESRRDNLIGLYANQRQQEQEASALAGKAQSFLDRFVGVDDERIAALASDPRAAATLEDQLREVEVRRADGGLDLPPLQGEALLDLLVVKIPETGEVRPVDVTLDDLLTMDLSDPKAYQETVLNLGRTQPGVEAYLSPSASFIPDPTVLKEGRALFDAEIRRAAQAELAKLDSNSREWSDLRAKIDSYGDENSSARMELQDMYGVGVAAKMLGSENRYITSFKSDPLLSPYVSAAIPIREEGIRTLNEIIADPNTPEDQRQEARSLLITKFGFNAGSNP